MFETVVREPHLTRQARGNLLQFAFTAIRHRCDVGSNDESMYWLHGQLHRTAKVCAVIAQESWMGMNQSRWVASVHVPVQTRRSGRLQHNYRTDCSAIALQAMPQWDSPL
jgi:hypothetical protein